MNYLSFISALFLFLLVQTATGAVLDEFLNDANNCELRCEEAYPNVADFEKACAEGCRLFKLIRLAKGLSYNNKTVGLCFSACTEAYINESSAKACSYGCQQYVAAKSEEETQTIHLLTPLFYMRSAYNSMAHHVRQFISASWTVYVQEDAGKMVVLQSSPKVYEIAEPQMASSLLAYEGPCEQGKLYCKSGECLDIERFCDGILDCADGSDEQCTPVKERSSYAKNHQSPWQEEKLDWMDCISHQSGIPRWCLVIVLFGFILALLWLCCATAVTAPNHYLSSKKKSVSYVLLCEPNPNDLKPPPPLINCDEEAPPLPPKVSLI